MKSRLKNLKSSHLISTNVGKKLCEVNGNQNKKTKINQQTPTFLLTLEMIQCHLNAVIRISEYERSLEQSGKYLSRDVVQSSQSS